MPRPVSTAIGAWTLQRIATSAVSAHSCSEWGLCTCRTWWSPALHTSLGLEVQGAALDNREPSLVKPQRGPIGLQKLSSSNFGLSIASTQAAPLRDKCSILSSTSQESSTRQPADLSLAPPMAQRPEEVLQGSCRRRPGTRSARLFSANLTPYVWVLRGFTV